VDIVPRQESGERARHKKTREIRKNKNREIENVRLLEALPVHDNERNKQTNKQFAFVAFVFILSSETVSFFGGAY